MDFHTHDLHTPPGAGIVCLPREVLVTPQAFSPTPGALYAAGIHPWWTDTLCDAATLARYLAHLDKLAAHPQVVQIGECGLDALRGAPLDVQRSIFDAQIAISEARHKPVTIHCVRAFDRLLQAHKQLRPTQQWTIHGFRGKPALARQLLAAGFDLSFGPQHNAESYAITPPHRRHDETDAPGQQPQK